MFGMKHRTSWVVKLFLHLHISSRPRQFKQFSQEDVFHEPCSFQVRGQDSGPALVWFSRMDRMAWLRSAWFSSEHRDATWVQTSSEELLSSRMTSSRTPERTHNDGTPSQSGPINEERVDPQFLPCRDTVFLTAFLYADTNLSDNFRSGTRCTKLDPSLGLKFSFKSDLL